MCARPSLAVSCHQTPLSRCALQLQPSFRLIRCMCAPRYLSLVSGIPVTVTTMPYRSKLEDRHHPYYVPRLVLLRMSRRAGCDDDEVARTHQLSRGLLAAAGYLVGLHTLGKSTHSQNRPQPHCSQTLRMRGPNAQITSPRDGRASTRVESMVV